MENNINGFEATFLSGFDVPGNEDDDKKVDIDTQDDGNKNNIKSDIIESPTDEELDAMRNKNADTGDNKSDEDGDGANETEVDNVDGDDKENEPVDDQESAMVTGFFDSLAEKLNWSDVTDEEKPRNAEELIDYFSNVITENSKPTYASEEMAKLDQYVHNGGDLRGYLREITDVNYDNITLTDNESAQKSVLADAFTKRGYDEEYIQRRIANYEDAGILETEAEYALNDLKQMKDARKEQLLEEQKKQYEERIENYNRYVATVTDEIKNLDNIRGVKIPEADRKQLLEYIFKTGSDGRSSYQRDFDSNVKHLLESAYLTMKGDALMNIAKQEGSNSAINNFKKTLKGNSGVKSKNRRSVRNSNDAIWESFTKQLRQ